MNSSQKKEDVLKLVALLFEDDSDPLEIKFKILKLVLDCNLSKPMERLFYKCWRKADRDTNNYFSTDPSDDMAFDAFNSMMVAVSFIDLSTLE